MLKQRLLKILNSIEFIFFIGSMVSLILPWYVSVLPVQPTISDSYYYGFSNQTGLIILISTIGICIFLLFFKKKYSFLLSESRLIDISFNKKWSIQEKGNIKLKYKWLYVTSIVIFIGCLFLLIKFNVLLGEATYFIPRLYLMDDGLKPYVDFNFNFGYFLIYFPFYIRELFNFSTPLSYQISFFIESLIGYYSLWFVIKKITIPKYTNIIFLLAFIITISSLTVNGVNYTLMRYATPIAIAFWTFKKLENNSIILKFIFYVLLMFIINSGISPEMGISSILGLLFTFVFKQTFSYSSILRSIIGIIVIILTILSIPLIRNIYIAALGYSQGGQCFPWYFSPSIIIFFFFILLSLLLTFYNTTIYGGGI